MVITFKNEDVILNVLNLNVLGDNLNYLRSVYENRPEPFSNVVYSFYLKLSDSKYYFEPLSKAYRLVLKTVYDLSVRGLLRDDSVDYIVGLAMKLCGVEGTTLFMGHVDFRSSDGRFIMVKDFSKTVRIVPKN